MTHGEEPGADTHQDSAALTYLEGILMHQVAGGPGAAGLRRSEPGMQDSPEQRGLPPRPGSQEQEDRRPPGGGATQHLKKARLLRSEGWAGEPELGGDLKAEPAQNGQDGEEHHSEGAREDSPKCKGGESTLLASLLQSFSSRLQTVALSQQIMQNLKQPEPASLEKGTNRDSTEPGPCLGAASSRLKGLLKKNKTQNHSSVPYQRRSVTQRPSESSQPLVGSGKGPTAAVATTASDSLSCAARLKAVASLVNTRSSPAPSPSPRPSVACSQLALLLSSEAHLQQYSREQAMKARLSARSASERLAAMATQQSQQDLGKPAPPASEVLGNLNSRNGALSPLGRGVGAGAMSPRRTPQPLKEKRGLDRNSARPSQNCSSLLLHLLNNHNAQKRANGLEHPRDDPGSRPSRSSPMLSDSEFSNPETSVLRDSSDTESSCSSSSPIDLSVRSRVTPTQLGSSSSASSSFSSSSSSLDKLTESLINRWRPENPPPPVAEEKEPDTGLLVRPHHKVTLLQLLLDHRNSEGNKAKRSPNNPISPHFQPGIAPKLGGMAGSLAIGPVGRLVPVSRGDEHRTQSPLGRRFPAPPLFTQAVDPTGRVPSFSQSPTSPVQSTPLNLCKSKLPSSPDPEAQVPAFTASKLLQNLAQCGLQSSAPSATLNTPPPPAKLRMDPPVALLERLNAPILRNGAPISDMPLAPIMRNGSPMSQIPRTNVTNPASSPSEIESLLERRSVLQLILGSRDKSSAGLGKRKRATCEGVATEQQPDQLNHRCISPDIKVKVEPIEDFQTMAGAEDGMEAHPNQGEGDHKMPLSLPDPHHGDLKLEPGSPGPVLRDGLLSQLLKQQCRKLPVNAPAAEVISTSVVVKEEPVEPQAPLIETEALPCPPKTPPCEPQVLLGEFQPTTIPKKRRVCIEDLPQEQPVNIADDKTGRDAGHLTSYGSPERQATQNGGSFKDASTVSRGGVRAFSPANARGNFNVLKQLLLSDNCLRDLSQLHPRAAPTPSPLNPTNCRMSGSPSGRLVTSPWDYAPPGSRVVDRPHSSSPPWGIRDSPKVNLVPVKREADTEEPFRWAVGVEESPDRHPDSPRLTKANPILYYMLQRGNSLLGQDGRGLGLGAYKRGPPVEQRMKDAPTAHLEREDHKLTAKHYILPPEGEPEGSLERLNGSLGKC
ncbi:hypothetical protein GJAV_G00060390 [Gymnothorax javanicus]|nr:hypothetical protein GJAV_G00060390 [Gymnothorax javanicus]